MIVVARKFTWDGITGYAIPTADKKGPITIYRIDYFFLVPHPISFADDFEDQRKWKCAFRAIDMDFMKDALSHVRGMMAAVIEQNNATGTHGV